MASRNDRSKRTVPERDIKQVETNVNILVKLACLAVLVYFVYLEANGKGPINIFAWTFLAGAMFGKEGLEKFFGGKR